VIYLTDRWRRRQDPSSACDANEQMASFRVLYERGELSRDEFERIRNKLTGRLRKEVDPNTAAAEPAQSPPNDEAPAPEKPPSPPPDSPMSPQ